jgi:hypothetical protein
LLSILTLTTKRKKGKVRKEGRRRVVLRYHDLFLPFRVASSLLSTRTLLSLLPTSSLFTWFIVCLLLSLFWIVHSAHMQHIWCTFTPSLSPPCLSPLFLFIAPDRWVSFGGRLLHVGGDDWRIFLCLLWFLCVWFGDGSSPGYAELRKAIKE